MARWPSGTERHPPRATRGIVTQLSSPWSSQTLFLSALFLGMGGGSALGFYLMYEQGGVLPTTTADALATAPVLVVLALAVLSLDRILLRVGDLADDATERASAQACRHLRSMVPTVLAAASFAYLTVAMRDTYGGGPQGRSCCSCLRWLAC